MYSFHAYIDEAGDEGFKFRDFPEKGSSEWFILSACVVRATRIQDASRLLRNTLGPIEASRRAPAHFAQLPHEAKVALTHQISHLPIRAIAICVHKRALPGGHTLDSNRRLHFYAARLLLERISWIARDQSRVGEGNGQCQLTFSHCKSLSYERLRDYFRLIQKSRSQVAWPHVDVDKFRVWGMDKTVWLRVADAIASGVAQGVELSRHGFCEDRFAKTLRPVVYHHGQNYQSYGMKVMPAHPAIEVDRDNRYEWFSLYK